MIISKKRQHRIIRCGVSHFPKGAELLDTHEIVRSECRQNILRTLAKGNRVRIMRLVQLTGFCYNEVSRHLNILEEQALIFQEHHCGCRVAWLNLENENIPNLLNLIKLLRAPVTKANQTPTTDFENTKSTSRR